MKLRYYTQRNMAVPLLIVLSIWAYAFYATIVHEVNEETDKSLQNHKMLIIKTLLSDSTQLKDHKDILTQYFVREIEKQEADLSKEEFFNSTQALPIEMISIPVRGLRTCFKASNDRYYELTIITSVYEKKDMIQATLIGLAILYFALICCILLVSHHAFKKSLKPLYRLLEWLKKYRLDKPEIPFYNPTHIEEFRILNEVIEVVTKRNADLYNQQKSFIENASHELQTPLAVCLNKLELMSENPECTETILEEMADLHKTIYNISKLNKSLLLFCKIENKQFLSKSLINMNGLIRDQLEDFQCLYAHKDIVVAFKEEASLIVNMNESLAATLVTNLIKNAYIYNVQGGYIHIVATTSRLSISNSSDNMGLDPMRIFNRYERQGNRKESIGLGLAIVKSIANLYDIDIIYKYVNKEHLFQLTFK